MRRAVSIELADDERATLRKWANGRRTPARLVLRATIILHAAQGKLSQEIAQTLEILEKTVCKWRTRFAQQRLAGFEIDAPRCGRKSAVRPQLEAEIIRKTTHEKPRKGQVWSTRSMAKVIGASQSTINRVWWDNGLEPPLTKAFRISPRYSRSLYLARS